MCMQQIHCNIYLLVLTVLKVFVGEVKRGFGVRSRQATKDTR